MTGQHLVSNPRVWKEANDLEKAGFKILIFSTWFSREKLEQDVKLIHPSVDYRASLNITPTLYKLPFIFYAKLLKKIANILYRYFKIFSIYQEVYLPKRQLREIQRIQSDLFICHQEVGLLLGELLIQKGHKVAFDFEDLYSQDYLNNYRPIKLLRRAELFALANAVYITCPSESMAKYLRELSPNKGYINVVYNSFPIPNETENNFNKISKSFIWFSQTIGPGRGLEELLKALKLIQFKVDITFVGNISNSYKQYILLELFNTNHQVNYLPFLNHHELVMYIKNFDVGLALEQTTPVNKDLTISNKILLYLQSNLNVIATKTSGQLELQEYFPNQINYVDLSNIKDLAEIIYSALVSESNKHLFYFNQKYSWDTSSKKLVHLVNSSVQN